MQSFSEWLRWVGLVCSRPRSIREPRSAQQTGIPRFIGTLASSRDPLRRLSNTYSGTGAGQSSQRDTSEVGGKIREEGEMLDRGRSRRAAVGRLPPVAVLEARSLQTSADGIVIGRSRPKADGDAVTARSSCGKNLNPPSASFSHSAAGLSLPGHPIPAPFFDERTSLPRIHLFKCFELLIVVRCPA